MKNPVRCVDEKRNCVFLNNFASGKWAEKWPLLVVAAGVAADQEPAHESPRRPAGAAALTW